MMKKATFVSSRNPIFASKDNMEHPKDELIADLLRNFEMLKGCNVKKGVEKKVLELLKVMNNATEESLRDFIPLVSLKEKKDNMFILVKCLNLSIQQDMQKIARLLIKNGVYSQDEQVFFYMFEKNDMEIINILTKKECSSKLSKLQKLKLLSSAVGNNYFEIAKLLLERGFHVGFLDHYYESPLLKAVERNNVKMIKLLLKYVPVNRRENKPYFSFALGSACSDNKMSVVEELLKHKVDPNADSWHKWGDRPLHLACRSYFMYNNLEMIELLLKNEADVNKPNKAMETPLHLAIHHPEVIQLLAQHGAMIDAKSGFSEGTPLHLAAANGEDDSVRLLLSLGADVSHTLYDGKTAYHLAVKNYQYHVFSALMKHKMIDINGHPDEKGHSPMQCMYFYKHRSFFNREHRICKMADALLHFGGNLKDCRNYKNPDGSMSFDYEDNGSITSSELSEVSDDDDGDNFEEFEKFLGCDHLTYFDKVFLLGYEMTEDDLKFLGSHVMKRNNEAALELFGQELKELRAFVIGSYPRISLYDLFFENRNKIAQLSKNENLLALIEQNDKDLEKQFPHFGLLLNLRVKKGAERMESLIKATDKFASLIACRLPEICTDTIFLHFNNDLLQIFSETNFPLE